MHIHGKIYMQFAKEVSAVMHSPCHARMSHYPDDGNVQYHDTRFIYTPCKNRDCLIRILIKYEIATWKTVSYPSTANCLRTGSLNSSWFCRSVDSPKVSAIIIVPSTMPREQWTGMKNQTMLIIIIVKEHIEQA